MPLDMPESVLVRFKGAMQPGVTQRTGLLCEAEIILLKTRQDKAIHRRLRGRDILGGRERRSF